ncbi:DUF2155 domain-containing protein [Chthonobacter albigriseus]|uniref:DUF2155 domain-containing protein n=1 Tax=Chthonobacter albigriseus TaxID=1683161 RepID=UPI0015EF89BE|nr:DUF2155 domain-containing protein [Chthonobacter albigriseus]
MTPARLRLSALAAVAILAATPASAEKVANKVAVFTGLDKITGRIITFDVLIDETVQFGALRVTPRVCYTRPPTETAQTDAFVEVDEITLDNAIKRIFTGWMFAASPGLNAVEHPVYDVWLNDCQQDRVVAGAGGAADPGAAAGEGGGPVLMVDGIPVPRPKPTAPSETLAAPTPSDIVPDIPETAEETPGEILD